LLRTAFKTIKQQHIAETAFLTSCSGWRKRHELNHGPQNATSSDQKM